MSANRKRIYLMRHGHVNYRRDAEKVGGTDFVRLTEQGEGQAHAAGEAMGHIHFDRAICTGLPRTQVTAEKVLSYHEMPLPELEVFEGLIEVRSGLTSGAFAVDLDGIVATVQEIFMNADKPGARMGPAGEFLEDALTRSSNALVGLLKEPNWETALVVAHEAINRIILSWMAGAKLSAVGHFEQDTGCINVLDFDLDGDGAITRTIIKSVNLTPYNWVKHGMKMTSLEAIFSEDDI